jgi:hypothetical protein
MTNTHISKDYYGNWQAKTTEKITINGKPAHVDLSTSKHNKQIVTTLSVCWPSEDGRSTRFTVFQDYLQRLEASTVRATSKVVENQHAKHKANMPQHLQDVQDFYADKVY